jgi:hypothetical protein
MATTDETVIVHYCSACGALTDGRFCSACGNENTLADLPLTGQRRRFEPAGGIADPAEPAPPPGIPPAPPAPPAASAPPAAPVATPQLAAEPRRDPEPPRAGGSSGEHRFPRTLAIVAAGALGLAAAVVAAIVLLTGQSSTPDHYRTQLGRALSPLVGANRSLSRTLGSLDGSKSSVSAAQRAAAQAQTALGGARGAVGVLAAPASERTLTQAAQQALTEESGYLQAVTSTLAAPTGSSTGQLQTLATGAQSALVAVNVVAPRAGSSLSGNDNLTSWAQGAARHARAEQVARQRAARRAAARRAATPAPTTTAVPASPPATSSPSSGTDCGDGLTAGPATSCPFAQNVRTAWEATPGETNTVSAWSPVTNQWYTMSCGPQDSGDGILCTGVGADNSVWWQ